MTEIAQIFSLIGSIVLALSIILLVVRKYLTPGQSVLWLILAGIILLFGIFPGVFFRFSSFVGAKSAVSTMTFLGMVFFAGYSLYLSSRVASLERKIEKMAIFFAISKNKESQQNDLDSQEGNRFK